MYFLVGERTMENLILRLADQKPEKGNLWQVMTYNTQDKWALEVERVESREGKVDKRKGGGGGRKEGGTQMTK